jgi:hypothetical protein
VTRGDGPIAGRHEAARERRDNSTTGTCSVGGCARNASRAPDLRDVGGVLRAVFALPAQDQQAVLLGIRARNARLDAAAVMRAESAAG